MPSRIRHVTIDCHDPYSQAAFWADVLGFVEDQDNPNAPDDPEALITDPSGRHPGLLFIRVPDAKAVKNRVHVDLVPAAMRDETVVALLGRGATLVDDHRRADGTGWAVLADPEGNEFCVERSDAERGIAPPSDTGSDQDYPDGIRTADERRMLSDMLDWYRDAVLRKVDGISPATARTSPVRSGTTIAGLLKHLALVEDSWFTERFAGVDDLEPWVSCSVGRRSRLGVPHGGDRSGRRPRVAVPSRLRPVTDGGRRPRPRRPGDVAGTQGVHTALCLCPPDRGDGPPPRPHGHPPRVPRRLDRRIGRLTTGGGCWPARSARRALGRHRRSVPAGGRGSSRRARCC